MIIYKVKNISLAQLLTLPCLMLIITACSSVEKNKNEAVELTAEDDFSVDESEEILFTTAKELYEESLFTSARSNFDILKQAYPTSAYREFAELKAADSYFMQKDFVSSGQRYEQFTKDHPTSNSSDYAKFMYARSLQLQNKGPGRNMNSLEQAITAYENLIKEHRNSIYVVPAHNQLVRAYKIKKAHEEAVANFYEKRAAEDASLARLQMAEKELLKSEKKQVLTLGEASRLHLANKIYLNP